MSTQLTRRGILKALGIGAAVVAAEPMLSTLEPVRKLWFVGSNAPVGSRIEGLSAATARAWSLKINLSEEALVDARMPQMIANARELKRSMHVQMARDLEQLNRDLFRKIRSQEDLDAVRAAARLADKHYGPGLERDDLMAKLDKGLRVEAPIWRFANGTRIEFGDNGDDDEGEHNWASDLGPNIVHVWG